MKQLYTFLFTCIFYLSNQAQGLFEKAYAFSFTTQTYDCAAFLNEGWIMAGYDQVCDYPAVQFIDTSGNLLWNQYVVPAGYNYGNAFSTHVTHDSSVLVGGFVQLEDDIGFAKGFASALDPASGDVQWTQLYDLIPISIVEHLNENLYLFGFTRTIVTNSVGDSLTTFSHDPFLRYDILPGGNLVYSNIDSVQVTDLNGAQLTSLNLPLIRDMTATISNQIFLASDEMLLLLDENLNTLYSASIAAYNPYQVFLTSSDSGNWCLVVENNHEAHLLRFDDSLQLIFSKEIFEAEPIQSAPAGVEVNQANVAVWGNEVLTNPINTFILTCKIEDGTAILADADIALGSFSFQFDSLDVDTVFFPSLYVSWYYTLQISIENHGTDTIHNFILSGTKPSSFNCAVAHFFTQIDTLPIPPQGSIVLSMPVSFFTTALAGYPIIFYFDFCLHVAMPDQQMDSFLLNNVYCTLLTAADNPLEKEESVTVSPNPSDGCIAFENLNGYQQLQISDQAGNQMLNIPMNSREYQLCLESISSGIYFYRLTGEKKNHTGKLVIQR